LSTCLPRARKVEDDKSRPLEKIYIFNAQFGMLVRRFHILTNLNH